MKHSHSFLKYYLKNIYLKNNLHNVQKLYKKSKNVQKKKKIYIQLFKISAPHSVNSNLTLTVKLANFFAQNPRRKAHTFFCLHYSPKTIGCLGNHTCCWTLTFTITCLIMTRPQSGLCVAVLDVDWVYQPLLCYRFWLRNQSFAWIISSTVLSNSLFCSTWWISKKKITQNYTTQLKTSIATQRVKSSCSSFLDTALRA